MCSVHSAREPQIAIMVWVNLTIVVTGHTLTVQKNASSSVFLRIMLSEKQKYSCIVMITVNCFICAQPHSICYCFKLISVKHRVNYNNTLVILECNYYRHFRISLKEFMGQRPVTEWLYTSLPDHCLLHKLFMVSCEWTARWAEKHYFTTTDHVIAANVTISTEVRVNIQEMV